MNKTLEKFYERVNKNKNVGSQSFKGNLFKKWIGSGKTVLDIGIQRGNLTQYYSENNKIIGIDIDKRSLDFVKKKFGFEVYHIDLNEDILPFNNSTVDVVVISEVLEHVLFPKKVLRDCYRVLKPAGLIIGSVPNAGYYARRKSHLMGKDIDADYSIEGEHIKLFFKSTLIKLLKETGFKDIAIVGDRGTAEWFSTRYFWQSLFSSYLIFKSEK